MLTQEYLDLSAEILKKLIRFKSVNPPGECLEILNWIKDFLAEEGIEATLHKTAGDRGVLEARMEGTDDSLDPFLLGGHVDVVTADEDYWEVDPFAAEVKDGFIYGRGALDMKCMVAMEMTALAYIRRNNIPLKRDLLFVVNGDEESSGSLGAQWYTDTFWQEKKLCAVLNEGVYGMKDKMFKGDFFPVELSSKHNMKLKLIARDKPSHGDAPRKTSAIIRLTRAVQKLSAHKFPLEINAVLERLFAEIGTRKKFPENLILKNLDKGICRMLFDKAIENDRTVNAHCRTTIAVTGLKAGTGSLNAVPQEAEAILDVRMLPHTDCDDTIDAVKGIVDDAQITVELISKTFPTEVSDYKNRAFKLLAASVLEEFPEAVVAPYICIGGSDAKHFRRYGHNCYGLIPVLITEDELDTVHGNNERISLENLHAGTRVVTNYTLKLCQ